MLFRQPSDPYPFNQGTEKTNPASSMSGLRYDRCEMKRTSFKATGYIILFWFCCGLLPWTFPLTQAHATEVQTGAPTNSLIMDMLAAYGGEKNLAKVRTVYSKGSIRTFMREEKGISTRYFKRPRKLRAELFYPRASEIRIVNGFLGWRGSDTIAPRAVTGPPYLAMAYQFKYLDLPFGFLDKGYRITYLGSEQRNGAAMEVLQLVDDEGPTMRVSVDPGTHLIKRVAATFGFGQMTSELSAEFSDYRSIDGIMVPFKVINFSGSTLIAETLVTEVQINREMPDSLFQP